jgi:multidrug efflux pump subunit AcrA (membrane-fusion protein)
MTADIEILKSKISDVIVIPSQFVTYEGDNAFVNIKNGNKVEKRQIVVGEKDGKGSVLVESGVTSGEVIAIEK